MVTKGNRNNLLCFGSLLSNPDRQRKTRLLMPAVGTLITTFSIVSFWSGGSIWPKDLIQGPCSPGCFLSSLSLRSSTCSRTFVQLVHKVGLFTWLFNQLSIGTITNTHGCLLASSTLLNVLHISSHLEEHGNPHFYMSKPKLRGQDSERRKRNLRLPSNFIPLNINSYLLSNTPERNDHHTDLYSINTLS